MADPVRRNNGLDVVRITASTELLRKMPEKRDASRKVAELNLYATLNAYVWDPTQRTLSLACSVHVHDENAEFKFPLLVGAVALQAADADTRVDFLASTFRARPAESGHPQNGPRPEPDDMLNVAQVFAYEGRSPSRLRGGDYGDAAESLFSLGVLASSDDSGLTAEVPFRGDRPAILMAMEGSKAAPETALLQVCNQRHPLLGSGAFMVLRLPLSVPRVLAAAVATRLNIAEAGQEFVGADFVGGWCVAPTGEPTFVTFLPTLVQRPHLLTDLCLGQAMRSDGPGTT